MADKASPARQGVKGQATPILNGPYDEPAFHYATVADRTTPKAGDLVSILFPFTELSDAKQRWRC